MTDEPRTIAVPAKLLEALGVAIYGELWQLPLARLLGHKQPRTVQRWAEAARDDRPYPVSVTLLEELLGHLETKAGDVMRLHDQVKEIYDNRR